MATLAVLLTELRGMESVLLPLLEPYTLTYNLDTANGDFGSLLENGKHRDRRGWNR